MGFDDFVRAVFDVQTEKLEVEGTDFLDVMVEVKAAKLEVSQIKSMSGSDMNEYQVVSIAPYQKVFIPSKGVFRIEGEDFSGNEKVFLMHISRDGISVERAL
jgi:mannose-6-phosphate isomerase class I